MNIVKHWKSSSSPVSRKRPSQFGIKDIMLFHPTILLGCLLATYMDLYFVGKGTYTFPNRLYPEIFSINILFTVVLLPVLLWFFLWFANRVPWWGKVGLIFILSLLAAMLERLAENLGFFIHSDGFRHSFSFIGYFSFLYFLLFFYSLTAGESK